MLRELQQASNDWMNLKELITEAKCKAAQPRVVRTWGTRAKKLGLG